MKCFGIQTLPIVYYIMYIVQCTPKQHTTMNVKCSLYIDCGTKGV